MLALESLYNRAFIGECTIGSSRDDRPVLATDGLNSCIGFSGWNEETTIAFMVHFYGPKQVDDFFKNGVSLLAKATGSTKSRFKCVLKGGCIKTSSSREIVERIKAMCKDSSLIFEITKEYPMSDKIGILKTLSLDTRTGKFGEYNKYEDVNPMQMSKESENRENSFDLLEKLIYRYEEKQSNTSE